MLVTIVVYSKELCVNYSVKGNEYILVFVFYTKFYFVILFNSIEHLVEVKKYHFTKRYNTILMARNEV